MKRLLTFNTFELLTETIHNPTIAIGGIKKMILEIDKIHKIKMDNIGSNNIIGENRSKNPETFHLELIRMNSKYEFQIEKILKKYQKFILPKIDIVMKYKVGKIPDIEYKIDKFDFDVLDTYTLTYYMVFKNIHTQRVSPTRFVYHCSDTKNRENIKKNGLIPKSDKDSEDYKNELHVIYPPAIFATTNTNLWGDGKNDKNEYRDIWIIDTKGLSNKWWYDLYYRMKENENKILTFDPIPSEHLKLIKSEDIWNKSNLDFLIKK